ncbi:MAG: FtsQ-type POTRA domain-containing protein [Ruminococcus sp.]|nr:FtsQ-type POTRA domain-containing protein [Ruminococcus sp.]
MSDRFDDYDFDNFSEPDIMDKIGESFTSVFSRKSRNDDNSDDLLSEFSSSKDGDDYELFVDESAEKEKKVIKPKKQPKKTSKRDKDRKPKSPTVRKIRNIIAYCAIVAVVLCVCVVLSLTVLFKTQNYEVSGNTKYKEAEIIDTCGIGGNENIFLANKRAAEKRLKKNYPYIEDVEVSFKIPETITIDIVEAVPSYMVKVNDTKYLVASSKGRVLEIIKSTKGKELPLFLGKGVEGKEVGEYIEYTDENTLEIINEISTVFADNGYKGITQIDATNTANISITYDGRIKIKIGFPEELSYKIRTAMTIIKEKLDLNGTETKGELDVSDCNTTKKSYFLDQSIIDAQKAEEKKAAEDQETDTNTTQSEEQSEDDSFSDVNSMEDLASDTDSQEESSEEEETEPLSPDDWYLD